MGALALLLPLIPTLIQGVEGIFANKPKSGTDKMDAVAQALRAVFDKLVTSGVVPGGTLTDDAIRGAIEAVFQQISKGGQVPIVPTSPVVVASQLWVVESLSAPVKVR